MFQLHLNLHLSNEPHGSPVDSTLSSERVAALYGNKCSLVVTIVLHRNRMPRPPVSSSGPQRPSEQTDQAPDGELPRSQGHQERTFTLAEVAQHDRPDAGWIAVNGKVSLCPESSGANLAHRPDNAAQ